MPSSLKALVKKLKRSSVGSKPFSKKWLREETAREEKLAAAKKLDELLSQLLKARTLRDKAYEKARKRCRMERLAAQERARALREEGLRKLREATKLERDTARAKCIDWKGTALKVGDVAIKRQALIDERQTQESLRRGAARTAYHNARGSTPDERREESDEEVVMNLASTPDMLKLWEKVKRHIHPTTRQSRTDAFYQYAHDHPSEVLEAIEDGSDELVRQLEKKEREAARELRRASRRVYTQEELDETPF